MLSTNKGSAYAFIYGLMFFGVMILLYILFSQVINVYIYPITTGSDFNLSSSQVAEADRMIGFWHWIPYMSIAILLFYWIHRTILYQDKYT